MVLEEVLRLSWQEIAKNVLKKAFLRKIRPFLRGGVLKLLYRRYEKIVNMFFVGTSMYFAKMQNFLHFTSILRAFSVLERAWPFFVKPHLWTLFRFCANLGRVIVNFFFSGKDFDVLKRI